MSYDALHGPRAIWRRSCSATRRKPALPRGKEHIETFQNEEEGLGPPPPPPITFCEIRRVEKIGAKSHVLATDDAPQKITCWQNWLKASEDRTVLGYALEKDLVGCFKRYVTLAGLAGVASKPKLHMMMHHTHRSLERNLMQI